LRKVEINYAEDFFLPAAGWRIAANGSLTGQPAFGHYWLSTPTGSSGDHVNFGAGQAYTTASDKTHAFSIRCVR